jgi:hypothetical protein
MRTTRASEIGCLIVLAVLALSSGLVFAQPAGAMPLSTTEQLEAELHAKAGQLQKAAHDLDMTIRAKGALRGEVMGQYKADPTRQNWLRIVVVGFSMFRDEGQAYTQLARTIAEVGTTLAENQQRWTAYKDLKERDLSALAKELEEYRARYQALLDQPPAALGPEQRRAEQAKQDLKRKIANQWPRKNELERTVRQTRKNLETGAKDANSLTLLAGDIAARRNETIAQLGLMKERYERGVVLGPSPAVEAGQQALVPLLKIVGDLGKSLGERSSLPEPGGANQSAQPMLGEQINEFLNSRSVTASTQPTAVEE